MIRNCKWCNVLFKGIGNAKYCESCRGLSKDVLSGRCFDYRQVQKCSYCNKEFFADRKKKYCTKECMQIANSERIKAERKNGLHKKYHIVCPNCKKEKLASHKNAIYCSSKCWHQHNVELSRLIAIENLDKARKKQLTKKICENCKEEYYINVTHSFSKYCSKKCSDTAWRKNNPEKEKNKGINYRAKKRGGYVEPIKRKTVYNRDNGICQICRKTININIKYPHPKSLSIDHILPLSLGGKHEYKNVQSTHLECNLKKGNRAIGEQISIYNGR